MDIKKDKINNYSGHRERLKNKFLNSCFFGWHDYEILEFALTFVLPQRDTKQVAKDLIKRFGSIKEVMEADINDLCAVKGIAKHSAVFILFLKNFSIKYAELRIQKKEKLSSPNDALIFLKSAIGLSKDEIFYAIFLNASNKILSFNEISRGVVNRSAVYPRKIAELALKYNATGVIAAHNHPGGSLKPSNEDIRATEAVKQALRILDIYLLDHIIVTPEGHYSFKDSGLI